MSGDESTRVDPSEYPELDDIALESVAGGVNECNSCSNLATIFHDKSTQGYILYPSGDGLARLDVNL
jgi:hypothetical protein